MFQKLYELLAKFVNPVDDLIKPNSEDIIITSNTPQPSSKPVAFLDYGIKAADLSKKYETGKTGVASVGFISNGMLGKDPGGISYGSYQLETNKGTMQAYLKTNDEFTRELKKLKVNSPEFKTKWRELAKRDAVGFETSQFNYLAHKPGGHYDALAYASKLGWNTNNLAMQSAIFSTVNQSGGWKTGIFNKTNIKSTDSIETQINKLYDARADYFRLLNLNYMVKKNIILNRTDEEMSGKRSALINERDDCLKLIEK